MAGCASTKDAQSLAQVTGASSAASTSETVVSAETIILAVPFDAVQGIPNDRGSQLDEKVLIDATNHLDPKELDGRPTPS